jgi:hypothetical protein
LAVPSGTACCACAYKSVPNGIACCACAYKSAPVLIISRDRLNCADAICTMAVLNWAFQWLKKIGTHELFPL